MSTTPTHLQAGVNDPSRSDNILTSNSIPVIAPASDPLTEFSNPISNPELIPPPATNDQPTPQLLSIPAPVVNNSRSSFALSDAADSFSALDPLSPEIASADITVAPDGSFVETSSGLAARELKKNWDLQIGVGKDVRSPYAITAFVNQHGKSMFRVGPRDLGAPAASAVEVEERSVSTRSSEPSTSPKAKRRSRMSMHTFLPQSMFKNGLTSPGKQAMLISQSIGPRKLRKTRSIPDLVSSPSSNDAFSSVTSPRHHGTISSLTGRGHSHSVTGADVAPFSTITPAQTKRKGDLFAQVMNWPAPVSIPSPIQSAPSNEREDQFSWRATIAHPFGPGVTYDSPSRKPVLEFLPPPHLLRETQSFESGLTARQLDSPKRPEQIPSLASDTNLDESALKRPPSTLQLRPSSPLTVGDFTSEIPETLEPPEPPEPPFAPSSETAAISHFSTDVYNVLQTYRGLPLLDKLSLESEETTVIRMSLSADESAAPRNDPRFVIWGESQTERDYGDQSISRDSVNDSSVHSSLRRRSTKIKAPDPAVIPQLREGSQKVMLAATIERWIAQLTSDLNYEELLDFFLTYRSYVDSVDLCHLFISRFHWALQQHASPQDERVRRIVRVRTFVAIRYWLLTFFTVDFLPNRELRLLLANWLNTLIRDPVLKKLKDGLGIVRRLIKVVKQCKQAHTRTRSIPKIRPRSKRVEPADEKRMHLLGEKFAAATRKSVVEDEDSDVDLDFLPDQAAFTDSSSIFHPDAANAHLSTAHVGAGLSPTGPASIPFSLSILQRTDHAPGPIQDPDVPFVQNAAMPIHHSALSRAFVKTIGRLGRWKRVLNSRAIARTACADVSAFDVEMAVSRDLLTVNDGVEDYLASLGPRTTTSAAIQHKPASTVVPGLSDAPVPPSLFLPTSATDDHPPKLVPDMPIAIHRPDLHNAVVENVDDSKPEVTDHEMSEPVDNAASFRSSSTDSFGSPLASGKLPLFPPLEQAPWQFDVASIDDLDFSDTSSDFRVVTNPTSPPGLRKPPRKLPLRRDFEFVRRETVSSMGIVTRESRSNASSVVSSPSATGFGGNIAQWQINSLIDSLSADEEAGDVEDALRRLEGQINPEKQQEKASKVDGWVRTMLERMVTGDYVDEKPRFLEDDPEYENVHNQSFDSLDERDSASQADEAIVPVPSVPESSQPSGGDGEVASAKTPIATQITHFAPTTTTSSPTRPDAKPAPEDAVPLEILQSRVPSRPSTASSQKAPISRFGNPEATRIHRSWLLGIRTAVLANHFAMIDRDLFMGVKFEELVLDDWMRCEEVNVLDWTEYLNDRARWRAESRFADKTTALAAVRGRFTLMANFTISEIVLTPPNERPLLVAKFIRIAWKSYLMCNFASLVAIITGLQSDWVTRAMRRSSWSRVGIFETRMFKDLKVFTANVDDFLYIRQVVESIVEPKNVEASSHSASVVSTDTHSGRSKTTSERPASTCIPFIGIYLSQLQRYKKLPDLIDPTAPNKAVGVDPVTSNLDAPAHPEVFSTLTPLLPSMSLEPLINVHKQRRIAGVIKTLVAGQHLASRMQFEIDKKLYQRCQRLRGLDSDTLQRALAIHSE